MSSVAPGVLCTMHGEVPRASDRGKPKEPRFAYQVAMQGLSAMEPGSPAVEGESLGVEAGSPTVQA